MEMKQCTFVDRTLKVSGPWLLYLFPFFFRYAEEACLYYELMAYKITFFCKMKAL